MRVSDAETIQNRAIVTVEHQTELVYDLLNVANDPELPLT